MILPCFTILLYKPGWNDSEKIQNWNNPPKAIPQGLWQAVLTRIVSKKSAQSDCHPSRQPVLQGPYAAKGAVLPA